MKVTHWDLLSALEFVAPFIEKSPTIPVLNCALFEPSEGALTITTTDLKTGASVKIPATNAEPGSFCIPIRALMEWMKNRDDATDVGISIQEHPRFGNSHSNFIVNGFPTGVFPVRPVFPELGYVRSANLAQAFRRTVIAVSREESRFTLGGGLIDGTEGKVVATDGHRLSCVDIEPLGNGRLLIPRRVMKRIGQLGDPLEMAVSGEYVSFGMGQSRSVWTKTLTGNFPDYKRVMAATFGASCELDTRVALNAVRRVMAGCDITGKVYFDASGDTLNLRCSHVESHSANESIPVKWNGPPLKWSLNGRFVVEFLELAPETVVIKANNADSALELTAPGWRYIVMPLRM
jgi:DNA polymerase-3 subunit beta